MQAAPVRSPSPPVSRRVAQIVVYVALWSLALFWSAGTVAWPSAWAYLALYLGGAFATFLVLARWNPGLAGARGKWNKDTKPFDKLFMLLYVLLVFAQAVVAGFDAVRYRWAPLPGWWFVPGGLLFAAATAWITWAMAVNPYLETTVRIQHDRGHRVVTTGPYRYVRHPMYTGMFATFTAIPLMLGSPWSLVVSVAIILLVLWRTEREDATLQAELPGYVEYAARTRWKLIPGLH